VLQHLPKSVSNSVLLIFVFLFPSQPAHHSAGFPFAGRSFGGKLLRNISARPEQHPDSATSRLRSQSILVTLLENHTAKSLSITYDTYIQSELSWKGTTGKRPHSVTPSSLVTLTGRCTSAQTFNHSTLTLRRIHLDWTQPSSKHIRILNRCPTERQRYEPAGTTNTPSSFAETGPAIT
jgi:hypothetical protein